MNASEIFVIVILSVAATAIVTAYITLVIVGYVERRLIRKYLGDPREYMTDKTKERADEQRKGQGEDGSGDQEDVLWYRCKRDKDSWLLSFSSPIPDSETDQDSKVSEKKLPVARKARRS